MSRLNPNLVPIDYDERRTIADALFGALANGNDPDGELFDGIVHRLIPEKYADNDARDKWLGHFVDNDKFFIEQLLEDLVESQRLTGHEAFVGAYMLGLCEVEVETDTWDISSITAGS
jgi:hypothetical protein